MNTLKTSISLHSIWTVSWFSSVAHLFNLGCLDYRTLALSCITRKNYLINRLRKELEKLYVDQWEKERQNIIRKQQKSKIELYSNIKSSYDLKQGRHKNIFREQRISKLCCSNLVGDEFHYLFVCHEFSFG